MNWHSWTDFFAMSGYGLYVWGSLGMCAAVIVAEVALLKARHLSLVREMNVAHPAHANEAKL